MPLFEYHILICKDQQTVLCPNNCHYFFKSILCRSVAFAGFVFTKFSFSNLPRVSPLPKQIKMDICKGK